MKDSWNIDEGIKNRYLEKCRLFVEDDEAFANFKRDRDYGMILEGNAREVGEIAMAYLSQHGGKEFADTYFPKFRENDTVGNPETHDLGVSPATLRYINTAWEIKSLLGDFRPKRILEIGGGYGGLCKTLSVIYDFESYTDKDLPEAERLFLKYLSHFPALAGRVNTEVTGPYDLFIADSSLSECDAPTQLLYGNLAKDCKYIYLTYNTRHVSGNEKALQDLLALFGSFTYRQVQQVETQTGHKHFSLTLGFAKS